jgi:hypothetical protein
VLDGGDVEGVAVVVKAEPVIADAQAELGGLDVLEALHIALASGGEVGQGAEKRDEGTAYGSVSEIEFCTLDCVIY